MCLLGSLTIFFSNADTEVQAAGNQWFVSPTGSGTACSQAVPCEPQQAIMNAVDYDMIYFAGGTYLGSTDPILSITNSVSLYGGWDGAPTGDITLDPDTYISVIDGEEALGLIAVDDPSGNFITINGFSFTNGTAINNGGAIDVMNGKVLIENNEFISNSGDYGGAVFVGSSFDVDIRNNLFVDNQAEYGGGGIHVLLFDPNNANVTIEGNVFTGGNADYGTAISIMNSETLITNNLFKDTWNISAINISSSGATSVICNNIIVRPQQNGIDISGDTTSPHQIMNNTVIGAGYGIISYAGTYLKIDNNILAYSTSAGIYTFGGDLIGSNNLFYENNSNPIYLSNPVISTDPLFLDPDADNYHIQEGSPAQDAGISVPLSFDFDGETRPSGCGYDIGADEIMSECKCYLPLVIR
jgi:hypothetical protein